MAAARPDPSLPGHGAGDDARGTAERVAYEVEIAERTHELGVGPRQTRTGVTKAAPRQRAGLWLGGKLLAAQRLPQPASRRRILPDTGQRG